MGSSVFVERSDTRLFAERWGDDGPPVVLLHSGVGDRRCRRQMAELLAPSASILAYDRRGYGHTPSVTGPYSHLDDLLAVMDEHADEPLWLVGSSAGGAIAFEAGLAAQVRVAGLVLLAPAVSGAPGYEPDPPTKQLADRLDVAEAAGDLDEVNRLETWLWLDGPAKIEGRVAGPARTLVLAMNAAILHNGGQEHDGASGLDAWDRLNEVRVPVTVACGDLDIAAIESRSRDLAHRLPFGRYVPLTGRAHLPYLEDAAETAGLIAEAIGVASP